MQQDMIRRDRIKDTVTVNVKNNIEGNEGKKEPTHKRMTIRHFFIQLWKFLFLFIVGSFTFYLFFAIFINREDFFVLYNGNSWRPADFFIDDKHKMHLDTPLKSVDLIYVVSFYPLEERRRVLRTMLAEQGINVDDVVFGYQWDRNMVLDHQEEVSKTMFGGFASIQDNTVMRYTLGTREDRAFENFDTIEQPLTPSVLGIIATFMQHREAWLTMINNPNIHSLFVLEDDVFFAPWFHSRFDEVMNEMPDEFDIVYIGTCLDKTPPKPFASRYSEHLFTARGHRCANSYIISRKAALKLTSDTLQVPSAMRPVDSWMEYYMDSIIPDVYWVDPPLVSEGTKAFNPPYQSFNRASTVFQSIFDILFGNDSEIDTSLTSPPPVPTHENDNNNQNNDDNNDKY